MDWSVATVLIVLILAAAGVRISNDWRGRDNPPADAIGFLHSFIADSGNCETEWWREQDGSVTRQRKCSPK